MEKKVIVKKPAFKKPAGKNYKSLILETTKNYASQYQKKVDILVRELKADATIEEIENTIKTISTDMVQKFKSFYAELLEKLKQG